MRLNRKVLKNCNCSHLHSTYHFYFVIPLIHVMKNTFNIFVPDFSLKGAADVKTLSIRMDLETVKDLGIGIVVIDYYVMFTCLQHVPI